MLVDVWCSIERRPAQSYRTADLPTFYGKKRKMFLLLAKKTRKIFMLGKFSDILPAGDTELANFSVSTSPNSTEIMKLVLNNNTFIYIYFICCDQ